MLHPEKLDMMMYYEGRPCMFNGLYETTYLTPLKTYYVFDAYRQLYELGSAVKCAFDDNVYAIAATNGNSSGLLFTYFTEADNAMDKLVEVELKSMKKGADFELYILDEDNDMKLVGKDKCKTEEAALKLTLKPYTTYFIKVIGE
jgi:hypothetical protein